MKTSASHSEHWENRHLPSHEPGHHHHENQVSPYPFRRNPRELDHKKEEMPHMRKSLSSSYKDEQPIEEPELAHKQREELFKCCCECSCDENFCNIMSPCIKNVILALFIMFLVVVGIAIALWMGMDKHGEEVNKEYNEELIEKLEKNTHKKLGVLTKYEEPKKLFTENYQKPITSTSKNTSANLKYLRSQPQSQSQSHIKKQFLSLRKLKDHILKEEQTLDSEKTTTKINQQQQEQHHKQHKQFITNNNNNEQLFKENMEIEDEEIKLISRL